MCRQAGKGAASSRPFDGMNSLAAQLLLHLTAPMRFEGPLNVDLNEITTNLVPFPRRHFLLSGMAPFQPPPSPSSRPSHPGMLPSFDQVGARPAPTPSPLLPYRVPVTPACCLPVIRLAPFHILLFLSQSRWPAALLLSGWCRPGACEIPGSHTTSTWLPEGCQESQTGCDWKDEKQDRFEGAP